MLNSTELNQQGSSGEYENTWGFDGRFMAYRQNGYLEFPNYVVSRKTLTSREKELFSILLLQQKDAEKNGFEVLRPRLKTLANKVNKSRSSVSRILKSLKNKGWVEVRRTSGGVNEYTLTPPRDFQKLKDIEKDLGLRAKYKPLTLIDDKNGNPMYVRRGAVEAYIENDTPFVSFQDDELLSNFIEKINGDPNFLSLAVKKGISLNATVDVQYRTSTIYEESNFNLESKENTTLHTTYEGGFAPKEEPRKEEGVGDFLLDSLNHVTYDSLREEIEFKFGSDGVGGCTEGSSAAAPATEINDAVGLRREKKAEVKNEAVVKPKRKKRRTKAERCLFPGVREVGPVERVLGEVELNEDGDVVPLNVEPEFHNGQMEFEQAIEGINYVPSCKGNVKNVKGIKSNNVRVSVGDEAGTSGDEISAASNGVGSVEDGSKMNKRREDFEESTQEDGEELPSCMIPKPVSKKKAVTQYEERQKKMASDIRKRRYEEAKIRAAEINAKKTGKDVSHGAYKDSELQSVFDAFNDACSKFGYLTQKKMSARDKALLLEALDELDGDIKTGIYYAQMSVAYYPELMAMEKKVYENSNLAPMPYFNNLFVNWRVGRFIRILKSSKFKAEMKMLEAGKKMMMQAKAASHGEKEKNVSVVKSVTEFSEFMKKYNESEDDYE